jgi:Fic family protein
MYNWEFEKWAEFIYNEHVINEFAIKFAEMTGEVYGMIKMLDTTKQQSEIIGLMISEAMKTSEIEGEILSQEDVISSIRNKLGLNLSPKIVKDKRAENVAGLMLQVRDDFSTKLSEKMLKNWHGLLFAESKYINAGKYRKGNKPMQIISGRYGQEKVYFEAPPSKKVPQEMKQFVSWYNNFKTNNLIHRIVIKTAIAHLYFESIHPFEDGNGRIGRALIEKCLSESFGNPIIMSISTTIEKNKKHYYSELNAASKTLQIDRWLVYFAKLLIESHQNTMDIISFSVKKAQFFNKFKDILNKRQEKVIRKMFDAGIDGFTGGMTAKKYVSITKTSKATATRDLQELVNQKILMQQDSGRNTKYQLLIPD